MNKFTQHIPAFVDIDRDADRSFEFETTDELLNHEIVQRYGKGDNFSHFAISENHLMEIKDDGFHWWVVGYIEKPADVDLPAWDGGKHLVDVDGEELILTDEVVSVRGDRITLKDGRIGKRLDYPTVPDRRNEK